MEGVGLQGYRRRPRTFALGWARQLRGLATHVSWGQAAMVTVRAKASRLPRGQARRRPADRPYGPEWPQPRVTCTPRSTCRG